MPYVYTSERYMPDYESMAPEEQARWRSDFRVKMAILREAYPKFRIPEFPEATALEVIHQHYERYVHQVHVDNSVGNYKTYLFIFFAGVELFCVKVLGLDMGGYLINQLSMMNRYERLLVELGEKTNVSVESSWPVEARIAGLALLNAVIFLVVKLVASYFGPALGGALQKIAHTFLSKGDANDQIDNLNSTDYQTGVPEPPEPSEGGGGLGDILGGLGGGGNGTGGGGFDLAGLIGGLGSMLGGGGGNNNGGPRRGRTRASRAPTFTE